MKINGYGWGLAGYGPRDIGAYEFDGTGGITLGGAFRVVTSSLVPVGGAPLASGGTLVTATSPTSITVEFSGNINPSSIQATDLVLSGSADNPSAPVHATSLTWIDGDTVQFNLSGPLSLPGTLDVSIAPNTINGVNGQGNLAYSDNVVLQIGTPPGVVNPTPYPVTNPTSPGTPVTTPTGNQPPTTAPAPVSDHAGTGPVAGRGGQEEEGEARRAQAGCQARRAQAGCQARRAQAGCQARRAQAGRRAGRSRSNVIKTSHGASQGHDEPEAVRRGPQAQAQVTRNSASTPARRLVREAGRAIT